MFRSKMLLNIAGWTQCPFFQKAKKVLQGLECLGMLDLNVVEKENRDMFRSYLPEITPKLGPRAATHTSCPLTWIGENEYLGGCDDTLAYVRDNFLAGASISRAPRVTHDNDMPMDTDEYDYDLVVIGGGSGGLAASKEAASLGAKVMVLDYVKPSPHGSKWGLGGTCVNVGCIPKKLMHTAAIHGESMEDAKAFGWSFAEKKHDWATMKQSVQDHIGALNFGYKTELRSKGVEYKNMLGSFIDEHTLELVDKRGRKKQVSTKRAIVAVGGRPNKLACPGGELAISSDDLFSLKQSPGKTLVVGASYVALECAGFLGGLGYPTTVMVRSILLRGFDQDMANRIGQYMEEFANINFIRETVPTKLVKTESGQIEVFFRNEYGEFSDVFDTVFNATGRYADTTALGLDKAGVEVDAKGKIICNNEQTSNPHIYAIGDVVSGNLELTPVAIASGQLLSRRLFGGATEGFDLEKVPTTVFTPIEYGACGLSEEEAIARHGEENIEVYHSNYTPLEWSVSDHKPDNACYCKLICNKTDDERVLGLHLLGPNAGEITQGFGVAMRLGATYDSFRRTVGIHPTTAEELTTLTVTKASNASTEKSGC
eukprot:TRINITY_DN12302_c0_g1_i1.p1 TRINITY_DN12302_c0_g1~~TRINITY_DN12302_c0_g1_i1.p1  ORF type:complete len:599 (-),score=226.78 TRINITY_DN12302_c0_g1_i1:644-2440(-)